MMKINPNNGLIGFAFCDGINHFSMANKNNSYENWGKAKDFIQCTGFAYDTRGNTYGTSAGGESSGNTLADAYNFLTSRWTSPNNSMTSSGSKASHSTVLHLR